MATSTSSSSSAVSATSSSSSAVSAVTDEAYLLERYKLIPARVIILNNYRDVRPDHAKTADLMQSIERSWLPGSMLLVKIHRVEDSVTYYSVVAGGHRLFCVHTLQQQGKLVADYEVPCVVYNKDLPSMGTLTLGGGENYGHEVAQKETFVDRLCWIHLATAAIAADKGLKEQDKIKCEQVVKAASVDLGKGETKVRQGYGQSNLTKYMSAWRFVHKCPRTFATFRLANRMGSHRHQLEREMLVGQVPIVIQQTWDLNLPTVHASQASSESTCLVLSSNYPGVWVKDLPHEAYIVVARFQVVYYQIFGKAPPHSVVKEFRASLCGSIRTYKEHSVVSLWHLADARIAQYAQQAKEDNTSPEQTAVSALLQAHYPVDDRTLFQLPPLPHSGTFDYNGVGSPWFRVRLLCELNELNAAVDHIPEEVALLLKDEEVDDLSHLPGGDAEETPAAPAALVTQESTLQLRQADNVNAALRAYQDNQHRCSLHAGFFRQVFKNFKEQKKAKAVATLVLCDWPYKLQHEPNEEDRVKLREAIDWHTSAVRGAVCITWHRYFSAHKVDEMFRLSNSDRPGHWHVDHNPMVMVRHAARTGAPRNTRTSRNFVEVATVAYRKVKGAAGNWVLAHTNRPDTVTKMCGNGRLPRSGNVLEDYRPPMRQERLKREDGTPWRPFGEKSVQLYMQLIARYTRPGDYVMDFFGGTFSSAIAALMLDRKFIGCELDSELVRDAQLRIGRYLLQAKAV